MYKRSQIKPTVQPEPRLRNRRLSASQKPTYLYFSLYSVHPKGQPLSPDDIEQFCLLLYIAYRIESKYVAFFVCLFLVRCLSLSPKNIFVRFICVVAYIQLQVIHSPFVQNSIVCIYHNLLLYFTVHWLQVSFQFWLLQNSAAANILVHVSS